MPIEIRADAAKRIGAYRSRVFVGGSYRLEERLRLASIKDEVTKAGFVPVVADEVQLENVGDTHHETMVLLHSCRLAIFELSQLSGALMEIERVPDYGIEALVLYAAPSNQEYLPSRMLSTFIDQHPTIALEPYLSIVGAKRSVRRWLNSMRKAGFG